MKQGMDNRVAVAIAAHEETANGASLPAVAKKKKKSSSKKSKTLEEPSTRGLLTSKGVVGKKSRKNKTELTSVAHERRKPKSKDRGSPPLRSLNTDSGEVASPRTRSEFSVGLGSESDLANSFKINSVAHGSDGLSAKRKRTKSKVEMAHAKKQALPVSLESPRQAEHRGGDTASTAVAEGESPRKKRRKDNLTGPEKSVGDALSASEVGVGEAFADVVNPQRESAEDKGDEDKLSKTPERESIKVSVDDDPRLNRTLFVGNVSQNANQKDIKKIFKPFGSVDSVRIRGVVSVNPLIPKKTALLTNRLASFSDSFQAYVVFKDFERVEQAMQEACKQLNMSVFMDRHILVMPASHKRSGSRRQSLFLGNLPFDCTEEDVILSFGKVAQESGAQVVGARVNRDRETGAGRGVGFVTFDDYLGVQACLNAAGDIKIRGRVVRMEPAAKAKKLNTKSRKREWKDGGKQQSAQLYWQGAGSSYVSNRTGQKANGASGPHQGSSRGGHGGRGRRGGRGRGGGRGGQQGRGGFIGRGGLGVRGARGGRGGRGGNSFRG